MGGIGSGWLAGAKKLRVETHAVALRVGELARRGALRADASGTLTWGDPERAFGAVNFRSAGTRLVLSYRIGDGDRAHHVAEHIPLARVGAGFGGMRTYFRCPGEGCNRCVEVLYLANGRFRCRRCHNLAYESQYEAAHRRARRRATKMRARLRYGAWEPYAWAPVARPKGMWRRKFWRLQDAIDKADHVATAAHVMQLRALADKVCGSRSGSR
jgi:hypothetical protein